MSDLEPGVREQALLRLRKKRDFFGHLLCYIVVNLVCLGVWATHGADFGNFWPIFPLAGWGLLVVLHARDVFLSEPSESAIQKEIERIQHLSHR